MWCLKRDIQILNVYASQTKLQACLQTGRLIKNTYYAWIGPEKALAALFKVIANEGVFIYIFIHSLYQNAEIVSIAEFLSVFLTFLKIGASESWL